MTDPMVTAAVATLIGAVAIVIDRVGKAFARRYEVGTDAMRRDRETAHSERAAILAEIERLREENAELRADVARLMPPADERQGRQPE